MAMKTRIVAPPAEEPVTLAEIKAQLSVTLDLDDALLTRKGKAARQYVEGFIGGPLIATTYDGFLDAFPRREIAIPIGPLLSVASIAYADPTGAEQTLSGIAYRVDTIGGRIILDAAPETQAIPNAVRVRFTAGLAEDAEGVPEPLREAILQLAAWWYEQRETAAETALHETPYGVDDILRQHRGWTFG